MNDAWFCRPACPLSLSHKNKWSAAWQSWVRPVEWGRGDYFLLQPHLRLSEAAVPQGLPPRRTVLILPGDPASLSPPAEAVGDPGDNSSGFRCLNSHLHLLTGHRRGLWYDPALGGCSPPNPAAQQCPVHPAVPTTKIDGFSDSAGEDRQLSVLSHICSALVSIFFFPGQFSGPHYFEAFIYCLELFLSPITPASWKYISRMTLSLTGESSIHKGYQISHLHSINLYFPLG